jgi:hypothetical protein
LDDWELDDGSGTGGVINSGPSRMIANQYQILMENLTMTINTMLEMDSFRHGQRHPVRHLRQPNPEYERPGRSPEQRHRPLALRKHLRDLWRRHPQRRHRASPELDSAVAGTELTTGAAVHAATDGSRTD